MKYILSLAAVLGLAAGGFYYWKGRPAGPSDTSQPVAPSTAVVEPRNIEFSVSAAGDIGPADQVSVRPEINGRIEELPVDIGDQVRKGELLCRLDDRDIQIERLQRLTEIDGARLQLQKANRNYARSGQLFSDQLISREVFEDSRTEYDLATNAVDSADQALRLVDDRLRKARLLAPFDCTVLTRPVSLGQTVSGSAGFNSGTEIMTIANLNDMVVNAHVNQADVTRLRQGQEVEVQVESVPGLKMKGITERIAPQAVIKNGTKGFSARIAIRKIDARVRPGMTAILRIPVSSADNVLAVPLAAVFSEKGERFVFVKNEDNFERRAVLIGVTDYSHAEVLNGVAEGEVVSLDQTLAGSGSTPPTGAGRKKPEKPAGGGAAPSPPRPGQAAAGDTIAPGRAPAGGGATPPRPGTKPAGS